MLLVIIDNKHDKTSVIEVLTAEEAMDLIDKINEPNKSITFERTVVIRVAP